MIKPVQFGQRYFLSANNSEGYLSHEQKVDFSRRIAEGLANTFQEKGILADAMPVSEYKERLKGIQKRRVRDWAPDDYVVLTGRDRDASAPRATRDQKRQERKAEDYFWIIRGSELRAELLEAKSQKAQEIVAEGAQRLGELGTQFAQVTGQYAQVMGQYVQYLVDSAQPAPGSSDEESSPPSDEPTRRED